MVSVTLSLPEDARELMKKHSDVNWSGFIRKAIVEKTKQLEKLDELIKRLESDEEQEIIDWSVKLQRASRAGRFDDLKRRGLI